MFPFYNSKLSILDKPDNIQANRLQWKKKSKERNILIETFILKFRFWSKSNKPLSFFGKRLAGAKRDPTLK